MHDSADGYPAAAEGSLRRLIRRILSGVASNGLPGEHHFYLTFRTDVPGVGMPQRLRESYPEEMTIVLQHQFRQLEVEEEVFGVTLRFGGREERLTVPWAAIKVFADPVAEIALQLPVAAPERSQRTPSARRAGDATADVVRLSDFRKDP